MSDPSQSFAPSCSPSFAPSFTAVGDHGVLVEFAQEISDEVHELVRSLDHGLRAADIAGLSETVPAFVNLLVDFDPLVTDHDEIETAVRDVLTSAQPVAVQSVTHTAHVCYEDPFGTDLAAVANATGLSVEGVIDAHLAGDYRVFLYGFSPGYAYLGGVAERIQVPRKPAAIRGVEAGSVIIAGPQCLITTITMPTGWSVIGRSPTRVLTGDPDHPVLFAVGDKIRFERIDLATFDRLSAKSAP